MVYVSKAARTFVYDIIHSTAWFFKLAVGNDPLTKEMNKVKKIGEKTWINVFITAPNTSVQVLEIFIIIFLLYKAAVTLCMFCVLLASFCCFSCDGKPSLVLLLYDPAGILYWEYRWNDSTIDEIISAPLVTTCITQTSPLHRVLWQLDFTNGLLGCCSLCRVMRHVLLCFIMKSDSLALLVARFLFTNCITCIYAA